MIHYHGLPITPATAAVSAVAGGHAFVSYQHPQQLSIAIEVCQSFAVDNGAFSAWKSGKPITNWTPYFDWVAGIIPVPSFDWAVIPDVIDGTEADNDALLSDWPHAKWIGAPVWHLHESLTRLERLVSDWPRICLGSSGAFSRIGTLSWWDRMAQAMGVICDPNGRPLTRIHGLRMLDRAIVRKFPFASADSTNIARNIGIDSAWRGTYTPPTKEARATVMRLRIEGQQSPVRWDRFTHHTQVDMWECMS
ncbi:MAG: hypothetical protein AAGC58_06470 [Asticcacaulis sp.]